MAPLRFACSDRLSVTLCVATQSARLARPPRAEFSTDDGSRGGNSRRRAASPLSYATGCGRAASLLPAHIGRVKLFSSVQKRKPRGGGGEGGVIICQLTFLRLA
jgi:hypothetical protein